MFEKDKSLMNGAGEQDLDWITTENGVHIPIKDGQTKKEAINSHFNKIENKEQTDAVKNLISTLKSIKIIKNKELINYIKNLEPIKLQINDKYIVAQFDIHTARENIYGDRFSDNEGYKFKIKNIKNLSDYIGKSNYSYSSAESGKNTKAHKGVKEWHYFVNQIQTDVGKFDINVNVRDKGNNQYVYLVTFHKKT